MALSGSALAIASSPAHAATGSPARPVAVAAPKPSGVTVENPGPQTSLVGAAVSLQITATDTSPVPLLAFSATGLPPGLSVNPASGLISGTTTAAYTGEATVTATDDFTGKAGAATFEWTVGSKVTVKVPAATEKSWVGVPVSVQAKATDSDAGAKLTYSAKGLPAGLSVNPGTGLITGRPQRLTTPVTVTVAATDSTGSVGTAVIKWSVGYAVIIPDPGKVTATAGKAIDVPISYSDVFGRGVRVTLSAPRLPRGLMFRPSTPLVYGWPAATGSYTATIRATDSRGGTSTMTFPLVVRSAIAGPGGQIHLALDGKCLTDPGNRTSNGTRVSISGCQAGAAEHWTIASDGTIRVHNHCLDIAGAGGTAGQRVQLWQCDGGTRETWLQGTAGELVNPAAGQCLTDSGSGGPTMGACRIRRSAAWTLPAQPVLSSVPGKCVDDHFSSGVNGNIVDTYSCNGTAGQAWTFEPDGTLRMFGGKCVTVRGRLGRVAAKIELWTCTAALRKAQQWAVVRTGGLSSELALGGVCLAMPSMTAADGTQLVTGRCTATDPRVHWHIL